MNFQDYEKVMDNVEQYMNRIEDEYMEEAWMIQMPDDLPDLTQEDMRELDYLFD